MLDIPKHEVLDISRPIGVDDCRRLAVWRLGTEGRGVYIGNGLHLDRYLLQSRQRRLAGSASKHPFTRYAGVLRAGVHSGEE